MKKLLITTILTAGLAGSVLAQGQVNLPLQTTHLAQYSLDGTTRTSVPVGNPATVGSYGELNIQLYYAPDGTASPFTATTASSLSGVWQSASGAPLHQILGAAGITPATIFTLPTILNAGSAEVMILAWTGNFTDWNSAFAAGTGLLGWTGSTMSGGALAWSTPTGNSAASPPDKPVDLVTGALGYNGIVLTAPTAVVPEPSSFALAGLGIAALLAFRRRN